MLKNNQGVSRLENVRSGVRKISLLTVVALVAACSMPESMGVRSGGEPRHQDDHVRFRTTYFFRVFDYCSAQILDKSNPDYIREIKHDSLYRFKMTGKANSTFTKVVFESGTLKSYEIDPLGAKVAYDKKNEQFYFQSREKTERDANCAAVESQMEKITARITQLRSVPQGQTKNEELIKAFENQLLKLAKDNSCLPLTVKAQLSEPEKTHVAVLGFAGKKLSTASAYSDNAVGSLVYELNNDKNKSITVKIPKITAQLKTAGESLEKISEILDSTVFIEEASNAFMQNNELNTGVTVSDIGLPSSSGVSKKIDGYISDARSNLALAGSTFRQLNKKPHMGNLYLPMTGAHLVSAADQVNALVGFLKKGEDIAADSKHELVLKSGPTTALSELAEDLIDAGKAFVQAAKSTNKVAGACRGDEKLQRGFQVIGPQGAMLYNQDDRLVMAMSTSASPLLQQLKDISSRVLAEQEVPGQSLLTLTRARLKLSKTKGDLKDAQHTGTEITKSLDALGDTAKKGVKQ